MPEIAALAARSFRFAPDATAPLVIDTQRDFLDPAGLSGRLGEDIAPLRAIVPRLGALLAAARRAGLLVVHTREGHAPDLSDVNPVKRERGGIGAEGPLGRGLIRGEPGHDFIEALRPMPGEPVIDKGGYSAFYRTDLDAVLGARGIGHLIVTGVTTRCCVHSTLRDVVERGFRCLIVADACAAFEPEVHAAALRVIQAENHRFGWLAETADVIAALGADLVTPGR